MWQTNSLPDMHYDGVVGPAPTNLELLSRLAATMPQKAALMVGDDQVLTFGAWDRRSDAVAEGLVRRGVAAGQRVLVVVGLSRWVDLAVCSLALHKVGAVPVPMAPPLVSFEIPRVAHHCGAVGVIAAGPVAVGRTSLWTVTPAELEAGRSGERRENGRRRRSTTLLYSSAPLSRPRLVAMVDTPSVLPPAAGSLVHAFAAGSPAGQAALELPLLEPGAMAIVVPDLALERLAALVERHGCARLGLPLPLAHALARHGDGVSPRLRSVTQVILADDPSAAGLVEDLRRVVPEATVVSFHGARGRTDTPPRARLRAPVATSQEGMIWHEQLSPGCQNLPALSRRYRGPLDVGALQRSLEEIIRRHGALRTTFELVDGQLGQVVAPRTSFALTVIDVTELPARQRHAEVERLVADASSRPFDLVVGPLFEPILVRLADDDHVLVIRVHHSVFDDWSVGPFRRELSALYAAFLAGAGSPLPPPGLQFADVARLQHGSLSTGSTGKATNELVWWTQQLAGAPAAVQLPIADPDAPVIGAQPAAEPVTLDLPSPLVDQLSTCARHQRATPFMVMLAAFCVLVRAETGQDDLVVASVVANRNRTEVEGMIGCFTKKILLRLRIDDDPAFSELVLRARNALLAAFAHQDVAYEAVVQGVLGPGATLHGLAPTVGIVFQGETGQAERTKLELPGIATTGFQTASTTARAHFAASDEAGQQPPVPWGAGLYLGTFLILSIAAQDGGLRCVARGAFHRTSVQYLLERYQELVSEAVSSPGRKSSELARRVVSSAIGTDSRRSETVDLLGFRIRPDAIEGALRRAPGVADAAVVVRAEPVGTPRLVAYLVAPGGCPTIGELRRWVWRCLPGYAWPSAVVPMTTLPRLPGGRLDVTALPECPAEADGSPTPEEAALAGAWVEAGGPVGGGSYWQRFTFLDAVAAAARAGLAVSPRHVSQCRTVEMLGAAVACERAD